MTFMLTEQSATSTGLTATADENNIPLPTDHSGLVKYESRVVEEYSIVNDKLRVLVLEAITAVDKRMPNAAASFRYYRHTLALASVH